MTDCFRDPAPRTRAAVDVSAPDGVRLSRSRSGGVDYVTLAVAEGTRLEQVVTQLSGVDPRAVFVSATGGTPGKLLFRVGDPERVEASGRAAGSVPGGTGVSAVGGLAW